MVADPPAGTVVVCADCAVRLGLVKNTEAFRDGPLVDEGFNEEHYLHVRECSHCGLSKRPGAYMLQRGKPMLKMQRFKVWSLDTDATEDDAHTFECYDAQDAAQEWARWKDSRGDYTIVGGSNENVCVRCPDGSLARFVVSGRTEAAYYARAVKEASNG